MIVATAGHVDHGKTRLVHALTGIETDRLEAEQTRGLTIDLGFAYATVGDHRIGFIDVPGHIRFINNMLAGVSVIDAGLLVIAADDGPMPQTLEHLAVLDLLGIDHGLVAITKTDRVSPDRLAEVETASKALLAGTGLAGAAIYPVSSATGAGIDALTTALEQSATATRERQQTAHFRLAIDRAFSLKGAGVVVTGSAFSGHIAVGDEVVLLPNGQRVRIRSLHRQNVEAQSGGAGDRLALNLAGDISVDDIHRGHWITTAPVPTTRRIDARIRVLPQGEAIRHWTPVHVHSAASHTTGRIATLEGSAIAPGETALAQIVLAAPMNLWRGDRVILRDQSAATTLGGGAVIDPYARSRGRTKPDRLDMLQALSADTLTERLHGALQRAPKGLDWPAFVAAEGMPESVLDEILADAGGVLLEESAITGETLAAFETRIPAAIEQWHKDHPTQDGITQDWVAGLMDLPPALTDAVVERLVQAGKLQRQGGRLRRPGQQAALEPATAKLWEKIEPILRENPTRPPVVHELAERVNLPAPAIDKLLGQCAHLGLLVRPAPNRFFLPEAMDTLLAQARQAADDGGGEFTVKAFRDLTGIGRNLSIEILEYFDRTGQTVRIGDKRKLQQRKQV